MALETSQEAIKPRMKVWAQHAAQSKISSVDYSQYSVFGGRQQGIGNFAATIALDQRLH